MEKLPKKLPKVFAQAPSPIDYPARRQALRWLGAGLLAPLLLEGCGGSVEIGTGSSSSTTSCSVVPSESSGSYPADGSNTNSTGSTINTLSESGIVRADIRSSFGTKTTTAAGIPLTVTITLVDTSCDVLSGYAIYLWHCDRDGQYSLYTSAIIDENYLRGVQATNSSGQVSFLTIFPGCTSSRMPHLCLEVYASTAKATSYANKLKTTQLAFPTSTLNEVYSTTYYASSAIHMASQSYSTDSAFSDGTSLQTLTMSGNAKNGYTAAINLAISV
ncbi:MAG: hypothetical protein ACRCTU_06360 [Zoogloea sp.]|uniref:hypothetical protein n=1 Tax=Zoogloea sp. TaxID=49181 RepID=UPI003F2FEB4B